MTREEAIEVIKEYRDNLIISPPNQLDGDVKALDMAIQALSQEPCDDAISRILKRMWNCRGKHTTSIDKVAMEQIIRDELPPVMQKSDEQLYKNGFADGYEQGHKDAEQKSGKWHRKYDRIVNDLFWECDKCGCGYQHEYNYCPNCGACMKDGRTLDEFIEDSKESEVKNEIN